MLKCIEECLTQAKEDFKNKKLDDYEYRSLKIWLHYWDKKRKERTNEKIKGE